MADGDDPPTRCEWCGAEYPVPDHEGQAGVACHHARRSVRPSWRPQPIADLAPSANRADGAIVMRAPPAAAVDLYWIPLGAGNRCVRFNGRVYEVVGAAVARRPRVALFHSALIVELDGECHAIEVGPSPDADLAARGVVATGPVGSWCLGWLRLFRYEVRRWPGGTIPDLAEAVGGPSRLTVDSRLATRLLRLVPTVPTPVWGRDELRTGDMWNSNSVIAWLIARTGLPTKGLRPPLHGRAPGWQAGVEVARRGVPEPSPGNAHENVAAECPTARTVLGFTAKHSATAATVIARPTVTPPRRGRAAPGTARPGKAGRGAGNRS
jgi:hypothetical protein